MTREYISNSHFPESAEHRFASGKWDVEVLIGFSSAHEEPGVMLKDDDVRGPGRFRAAQLRVEPGLLCFVLPRSILRRMNQARIQDDSVDVPFPEAIVVRAKFSLPQPQALGRGLVADVVIARYVVHANARREFSGNPLVLCNLGRLSGFIHEIAAYDHKARLQAVRRCNRELEIRCFLSKVAVLCIHPELRIRHLQEEER